MPISNPYVAKRKVPQDSINNNTGGFHTAPLHAAANGAASSSSTNNDPSRMIVREDRDHHLWMQPHVLSISTRQQGNPIVAHIKNVPIQMSRMVPDYIMSPTRCALYLSLQYHLQHPAYIHTRIAELGKDFVLRILLVLVDVEDNNEVLLALNKLAVTHNFTLLLAWSELEAARYLETFKALDGKDASMIQRKEATTLVDQVTDVLTRTVNKTDAMQLMASFGSFRALTQASPDEFGLVPGMGQVKVKRLHDAFHKPFSRVAAKKRQKVREQQQMQAAKDQQPRDDDGNRSNLSDEEERKDQYKMETSAVEKLAIEGAIDKAEAEESLLDVHNS